MRHSILMRRVLSLVMITFVFPCVSGIPSVEAGLRETGLASISTRPRDVRRVLVAFVRFSNDTLSLSGCPEASRQWKEPDALPQFADMMLAADSIPPFDPWTLTDYYHRQSRGQMLLYGEVYPDVYETEYDDVYYSTGGGGPPVYALSKELLHAINDDPRIDLSAFDANTDGYVDYLLVIVRRRLSFRLNQSNSSGISTLEYRSRHAEFGNDPDNLKKIRAYGAGAYVLYDNPGNIFPTLNLFRLVAHEIGHSVWAGSHRQAIGGASGVPENDPERIAYALMAAEGNCGGSLTISAAERDVLHRDWIVCTNLSSDTTVTVRDLYTSSESNCFTTNVRDVDNGVAVLYLSNRQRIGYFEQLRRESCYGGVSDHGLMATGLLATKVDRSYRMASLAADNTLELGVLAQNYAGDLFAPPSYTQLTPWTSPNIHGMSAYPPGFRLGLADFVAIDNIRFDTTDTSATSFDFRSDFRRAPTFRSNSRIGEESRGVVIAGPLRVAGGSWLSTGTEVLVSGRVVVDEGSGIQVESGTTLTVDSLYLEPRSALRVDGHLTIVQWLDDRGATIHVGTGGAVNVPTASATDYVHCRAKECAFSLSAYPNPFSESLSVEMSVPSAQRVTVEVFDALGRRVTSVQEEIVFDRGKHVVVWRPAMVAPGIYVVWARGIDATITKKVIYAGPKRGV